MDRYRAARNQGYRGNRGQRGRRQGANRDRVERVPRQPTPRTWGNGRQIFCPLNGHPNQRSSLFCVRCGIALSLVVPGTCTLCSGPLNPSKLHTFPNLKLFHNSVCDKLIFSMWFYWFTGWVFCVHCGVKVEGVAPPQPQQPGGGDEGMEVAAAAIE